MTTDLRYPVGRFARPASFTQASRSAVIAAIDELPTKLRHATHRLSDAQLDTPYRPGGWTVRQVVHHLADSHLNAYVRTRLALTEENPTIKPYDEAKWAELADARSMPTEPSLSMLDAIHARWVALLKTLTSEHFPRSLMHPENGPMSIDSLLELYGWHGRHHVAHVTSLRTSEGW